MHFHTYLDLETPPPVMILTYALPHRPCPLFLKSTWRRHNQWLLWRMRFHTGSGVNFSLALLSSGYKTTCIQGHFPQMQWCKKQTTKKETKQTKKPVGWHYNTKHLLWSNNLVKEHGTKLALITMGVVIHSTHRAMQILWQDRSERHGHMQCWVDGHSLCFILENCNTFSFHSFWGYGLLFLRGVGVGAVSYTHLRAHETA